MTRTIDQTLKQYESAINQIVLDSTFSIEKHNTGKQLLQQSIQLYQKSKSSSQKEFAASSLLYTMKSRMTKLYTQHLRLIKPALKGQAHFWKKLNESEENAKGFSRWLHHMKGFYTLLLSEEKYRQLLIERSVDLDELKKGQMLIPGLQQAYRMKQKCHLEKRIMASQFKNSLLDLKSWNLQGVS